MSKGDPLHSSEGTMAQGDILHAEHGEALLSRIITAANTYYGPGTLHVSSHLIPTTT